MEHNDATDKDLPADPDATELVPLDSEAMLHAELDAELALSAEKASREKASKRRVPAIRPAAGRPPSIATVRAMRAAPRASTSLRASGPVSSRFPASKSAIPRPPIHTLLPPADPYGERDQDDSDAAATRVFDRNSVKTSVPSIKASVPSVKSVAFPAPAFSAPHVPQPFHTVPAIPAAKRSSPVPPADESARTRNQPVLAPTSRRDLRVSAYESLAPMAMSAFPSAPPPARTTITKSSLVAIVLTMFFTLASMVVMGLGVFKPTAIDKAKIAIGNAMKGKQKHVSPAAAAKAPEAAASALPIAVPPVLIDDVPADLGEKETALFLPDSAKGHRVFVDGKVINENDTDKRVVVASCGKHKVQLGSSGKEQTLDLPCHGVAHPE